MRDNDIRMQQQRVIDNTPIITVLLVPRITNAPPILQAWNPTAKRTLKDTLRLHQWVTRNNTPGAVRKIIRPPTCAPKLRVSPRKQAKVIPTPRAQAATPTRGRLRTFAQQAINVITTHKLAMVLQTQHSHHVHLYHLLTPSVGHILNTMQAPWSIRSQAKQSPVTGSS